MIGELSALLAAFCWALSAILYKTILGKTGYLTTNLIRSSFAVLFLAAILPLAQFQPSEVNSITLILLTFAAVTNLVIGDTFYFVGLRYVGVSRAQPISGSYPLYSMFLAILFLNESLTFAVLIGTPLTVIGTAIVSLSGNPENNKGLDGSSVLKGMTASIVAAVFWSVGLVSYKMALKSSNLDLVLGTFIRTAATLPFLLGAVLISRESKQIRRLNRRDVVMLAVAGILALGVGGILLFASLSLIDASRAIPLSSISPLLSLALASLFAGEKVTIRVVIGTVLIVAGIVLVTFYAQT